ncbi:MAG: dicarboxylate/amino acid:cation symporter [Neptunomonas phycophila]|uniref:dicarboxylate/amino acid:cation symporter n=1 Tax=Neptunomonas phycophila TaxID=1572645 RepID=UPI003B8E10AB
MSATKKDNSTRNTVLAMIIGTLFGVLMYNMGWSGPGEVVVDGEKVYIGIEWVNDHIVNGLFAFIGTVFIGSLKALVVPLVFCALFLGVTSLADPKQLGSLGGKALGIYLSTTAIAVVLAMSLALFIEPGAGLNQVATGVSKYATNQELTFWQTLASYIPENPLKMMVEGNMIPLILFTVMFSICYNHATDHGKGGNSLQSTLSEVDGTFMKVIGVIMKIAPYAVFCMLAKTMAISGFDAIISVGWYFFTVVLALFLHMVITYNGILVMLLARLNPITFMRQIGNSMMFAFSTSSSAAATPINIQTAEKNLGVSKSTASFTIPLGATVNMDGTAIMQGVATIFIAQAFNIHLTIEQMALVVGTAVAASVGTAAVPGVGLVMLAMVLNQVNIPTEGIALIIGVDRLLDMMRTAVNTSGDLAATAVIAKSEGELDKDVFNNLDSDSDDSIVIPQVLTEPAPEPKGQQV